jgi:hypothetical protein
MEEKALKHGRRSAVVFATPASVSPHGAPNTGAPGSTSTAAAKTKVAEMGQTMTIRWGKIKPSSGATPDHRTHEAFVKLKQKAGLLRFLIETSLNGRALTERAIFTGFFKRDVRHSTEILPSFALTVRV